jgi:cytochrome c-type biogenesis protein CcmE
MKKIHLLGIAVIAVAITILVSVAGDVSTYSDFSEAESMVKSGNNAKIHVVGRLKKDAQGNILGMTYNPAIDPNRFEFVLVDTLRREQKCVLSSPKPQDFEKSEQVVIVGKMEGQVFKTDKVILKCPSKYQEKKITS